MARRKALCGATAAFFALGGTVQADVAPMDVWSNLTAVIEALGGQVSATLLEGGTTAAVRDIVFDFELPLGLGMASVRFDRLDLLDNGDGTVTVRSPAAQSIVFSFLAPQFGEGSMTLRLNEAYRHVASGDPGDITYRYDAPVLTVELIGFTLSGPAFDDTDIASLADSGISGSSRIYGSTGTMRITEGDLLSVTFDASTTGQVDEVTFETSDGYSSSHRGSTDGATSSGALVLPADGFSFMALPAALRAGLSVELYRDVKRYVTNDVERIDGNSTETINAVIGSIATMIEADASGLSLGGGVEGVSVEILDSADPTLILNAAADAITGAVDLPLLATDEPESFELQLSLKGISLGDELWAEFDPEALLPRDPAELNVELTGKVGSEIDLVDFEALSQFEDLDDMPFSIHALTLRDLLLSAAGIKLTGSGEFTFDMDNLESFEGMPPPTGMLDMMLVGGNRLIDALEQMGALPGDQAMGTRMTLGLFAQLGEGEDTLIWNVNANGETGQIWVNGQRVR